MKHTIVRTRILGEHWVQYQCTCGWKFESDDLNFAKEMAEKHTREANDAVQSTMGPKTGEA